MSGELLLGFDVREVGTRAEAAWTVERRASYLLRDVWLPLSIDEMVWSSVFTDAIPRPQWVGANHPLWEDLEVMTAQFRGHRSSEPSGEFWSIAVSGHSIVHASWGPYLDLTTPNVRAPSWKLLGFDVADPDISGLSNCGYGDERGSAAQRWGPLLNEHHLFDRLEDAMDFKDFSDERVREHAPFFVLGLWRIG